MTQNENLIKQFKELFNGDPWLDSSTLGILSSVSFERAAQKPKHLTNSIWEITNHVISWREVVLARIHGAKDVTPEHNYFLPIDDTSEKAWLKTLEQLKKSQEVWIGFLGTVSDEKLSQQYLNTNYNVYDLIFGIMQHDAYHLGQLALLAKYEL
ncbi:MAG: DinB family protein [Flavobacterium sp.]|uniref:DinB family protein n=1 Tax=Flavobacterium sp. TaxID=239 RepID=UPI0011FA69DA|nr:DinB family protein [Flavobacterium sp.]RZJ66912.1 MAG: DinB family protein [Flavobacterium sp.]